MRYSLLLLAAAVGCGLTSETAMSGRASRVRTLAMIDSVSLVRMSADIRWLEEPGGHAGRVTFTPGNDSAVAYIHRAFLGIPGLSSVKLDTFFIDADIPYSSKPHVNVVATLEGKADPARIIVVGAHYDASASRVGTTTWNSQWSSIRAPGADDNASGIAAMLEAARLMSDPSFGFTNDYTVTFVAFGSEESGPVHRGGHGGSRHFAARARERGDRIEGMISVDMVAHNRHYTTTDIVSNAPSEWLGRAFVAARDSLSIPLITNAAPFAYGTYSDHASFWDEGYDAILLIEHAPPWDNSSQYYIPNPYYHTSSDTIETLNYSLLKRVTQAVIGTLASLSTEPTATGAEDALVPVTARLEQNYPNPFNPETRIRFTVAGGTGVGSGGQASRTSLKVYDLLGKEVAVLVDGMIQAGSYDVRFNASGLPSGVYVYRLTSGVFVDTRKMALLR